MFDTDTPRPMNARGDYLDLEPPANALPTHSWSTYDDETRCVFCDCRPGGRIGSLPCEGER